jgi:hypothetical protein
VLALFAAACLGFLLGGLLMFLLVSGRSKEDLVEGGKLSGGARRQTHWETEAAAHVAPGATRLNRAPALAVGHSRTTERVDA